MRITRLFGLFLVSVMATSLIAASVATAEPLILPIGATETSTSGPAELATGPGGSLGKVQCEKSFSTGEVVNPHLIGGIVVHFLGCKGKEGAGTECAVMSLGTLGESSILTATLHGVLGLALLGPGQPTTPAILFLPVKGKIFVTLLGSCIAEGAVSGNVAGIANPIGTHTLKGTINLEVIGGSQQVSHFLPSLGGLVLPELTLGGTASTESLNSTVTWSTPTEIT